ncbi:hypothetical protein HN709_03260, partial [Candidatus Peregrinibacteria bacterium]|nr:hypothetical protein [Candidatus Peregrinibacteria bacterium]
MPDFESQKYSLETQKSTGDIARGIVDALEKITDPAEAQKAVDDLIYQWKKDFLTAGFDVDNNIALSNFDAEKVALFENKLDALLDDIEGKTYIAGENVQKLFQKIKALDSKIDSSLKHIPLLQLELGTKDGASLTMGHFDTFNPPSKAGERIDIRAMGIAGAVAHDPKLNLQTTMLLDNPETIEHEGVRRIANYLEKTYFKEHPNVLSAFGITDIRHITPRQAVQIASYIPIERIEYSRSQASVTFGNNAEGALNDAVPIDKLFEWDKDQSGNGVCRNYASVAIGVLEAIKMLQDQDTSLIHNTYAVNIEHGAMFSELNDIPGAVLNHAWNGFFTVSRDPKNQKPTIDGVVLDSTWADSSSLASDPARVGNSEVKLDYTRERFFTLVQKFEKIGLLPPEKYIPQLLDNYKATPPLKWEVIGEQQPEKELLSPTRLFVGYRILAIFDDMPKIPDALKPAA